MCVFFIKNFLPTNSPTGSQQLSAQAQSQVCRSWVRTRFHTCPVWLSDCRLAGQPQGPGHTQYLGFAIG